MLFHRVAVSPHLPVRRLRDGVTGNTLDFESEDEGSIPSPAANSSKSRNDLPEPGSSGIPEGLLGFQDPQQSGRFWRQRSGFGFD